MQKPERTLDSRNGIQIPGQILYENYPYNSNSEGETASYKETEAEEKKIEKHRKTYQQSAHLDASSDLTGAAK
jgi:hypothetical protein